MSNLFILLLLTKFQFNMCGYLFILLLMNYIFYVEFFICLHMCLRFFFLSYSFVMFRIDCLLSIWDNLHIYIDIVFMGLVLGLKFLLIIFFFFCTWQIKYLYFFGEKSKLQPMFSSLGNNKFLSSMLYINLLNLLTRNETLSL